MVDQGPHFIRPGWLAEWSPYNMSILYTQWRISQIKLYFWWMTLHSAFLKSSVEHLVGPEFENLITP